MDKREEKTTAKPSAAAFTLNRAAALGVASPQRAYPPQAENKRSERLKRLGECDHGIKQVVSGAFGVKPSVSQSDVFGDTMPIAFFRLINAPHFF